MTRKPATGAWLLRAALLASAAGLALYIPYRYTTQLHAIVGLYTLLFPLSALLVAAGMILAVMPDKACDCSVTVRIGIAAQAVLWLASDVDPAPGRPHAAGTATV